MQVGGESTFKLHPLGMAQWRWEGNGISSGLCQVAVLSLLVSCVISLELFSLVYFISLLLHILHMKCH